MIAAIRQIAAALTAIAEGLRRQQNALDKINAQNDAALQQRAEWERVEREHMAVCERLYRQRVARSEDYEADEKPVRH